MSARTALESVGLAAVAGAQNDCHSGLKRNALQDVRIAGHAASVSSARQPGSCDQVAVSKPMVVNAGVSGRRVGTQAASSTMAVSAAARLRKGITIEVRPNLLGNGECPH